MADTFRIGIYGATGYTGFELVKILGRHPNAHIDFVTSQSQAGRLLSEVFPGGPNLRLVSGEEAPVDNVDIVFLCLPHGAAASTALAALNAGVRVVDLSADFRLKKADIYDDWYGHHPAPHLLAEAVYGLSEFAREALANARLVANPGCYPTSILLALQPVLQAGVKGGPIIADSKSGVSGAGRGPKQHTHFVEVADNFSPYKIGRAHRHLPEIEQGMAFWAAKGAVPALIFSPHMLPVSRRILSTIYVPLQEGWTEKSVRSLYEEAYGREAFVELLPPGEMATLAHVTQTNRCVISLTIAGDTLILVSAIDNLVKGAAGQAVQNMNLMFGIEETTGLL